MAINGMSATQAREFEDLIARAGDFLSHHEDLPQIVREIVAAFESRARSYNGEQSEENGSRVRKRPLDDDPRKDP